MKQPIIAPSVLSADFGNLQRDIEMINSSDAEWIHVDVMDGHFVPNISLGIPVCEAISKYATKPLDVHLMISHPEKYLKAFKNAGASYITVHYEACIHLHSILSQIKDLGCYAGVAINPHTSVQLLEDIVPEADMVLIMTVNPGFGGQKFIENSYKKIKVLKEIITDCNSQTLIEVDGGVTTKNAPLLVEAGVDVLVAGNTIFKSDDPLDTIKSLKNLGN